MSDLLEDAALPPTVAIGDRIVPIGELNLYDRAELQLADRATARERLIEDCKAIGATQAETYQELEAFRDRRWGERDWVALAGSTDGQVAILERALGKANDGRGRDLLSAVRWSGNERMRVVALVSGLALATPDDDAVEGDPSDPR